MKQQTRALVQSHKNTIFITYTNQYSKIRIKRIKKWNRIPNVIKREIRSIQKRYRKNITDHWRV